MLLLVVAVGVALGVSFFCSILEAGLLSVQLSELFERRRAGDRHAAMLLELRQHRLDDAVGAILTLNTVAHTAGAVVAGAQAELVWGDRWVGAFSALLTLAMLVGTEIIPKTLAATHASKLVELVARSIRVLVVALSPALVLVRLVTRLISADETPRVSRGEVAALGGLAVEQGVLRQQESRILENALRLDHVRVADVMTPRTVAATMPAAATVADLVGNDAAADFSRIPIVGDGEDDVIGYVFQREVLARAIREDALDAPLSRFRRDVVFIEEHVSVSDGLERLVRNRQQLAIVTGARGRTSGVFTVEDAVETVLGAEIVGETDRVADLRALAAELRDRRVTRRRPPSGEAPPDPE